MKMMIGAQPVAVDCADWQWQSMADYDRRAAHGRG